LGVYVVASESGNSIIVQEIGWWYGFLKLLEQYRSIS
jgi:hypothetical protein